MTRNRVDYSAPNADLETAASRPSKTNCTTAVRPGEAADNGECVEAKLNWRTQNWKRKNALVDQFVAERAGRAARPLSVRDDVAIREEATSERHNGGRRSRSWSSVLNSFLKWYNGYRHAHLKFKSPDGETVRAQMPNSHQPRYGDKYYARLKALERQMVARYDNLTVCMLTFTGSTRNGNGGWRCPADHLRDVVNSWRPDEGRGAYHALRDVLDGYEWEYALVTEKHKSGYGHVHAAIFVDGDVEEADFRPVIDSHLKNCDIAHRDAHDYHHPETEKRPISVRSVDTTLNLEDLDANAEDVEDVTNLGSYVGEYIGAHGEELFDRGIDELAFRATAWATGTQMVRFSTGANEMIEADRLADGDDDGDDLADDVGPIVHPDPDWDGEGAPFKVENPNWTIEGVCRVDEAGEDMYDLGRSGVSWTNIEDASHLDPPNPQPPDRPQPRTTSKKLTSY